jgi:hypothetical protein
VLISVNSAEKFRNLESIESQPSKAVRFFSKPQVPKTATAVKKSPIVMKNENSIRRSLQASKSNKHKVKDLVDA